MASAWPHMGAPLQKKYKSWLVVLLFIGSALVLCAMFCGVVFFGEIEAEVTDADRGLLIGAEEIAIRADVVLAENPDTFEIKKIHHALGFTELTLFHEHETSETYEFISIRVAYDRDSSAARDDYLMEWGLTGAAGTWEEGVELVERSDYTCCDQSRIGDFVFEGQTIGMLFVAKEGHFVYTVQLFGFTIEDPEGLAALIDPRIEALSKRTSL